jgi:hypothetical protein
MYEELEGGAKGIDTLDFNDLVIGL